MVRRRRREHGGGIGAAGSRGRGGGLRVRGAGEVRGGAEDAAKVGKACSPAAIKAYHTLEVRVITCKANRADGWERGRERRRRWRGGQGRLRWADRGWGGRA